MLGHAQLLEDAEATQAPHDLRKEQSCCPLSHGQLPWGAFPQAGISEL